MATVRIDTVIRQLRRAVLRQDAAGRTDGQLLESFIDQKDEAAFEALVRRHGPMVLAVCRRVVRNHHDAEDAFQATFLVLARKASFIRPRGMVANWLHGVAYRTAMKARTMTAKRRVREKNVTEMPETEATAQDQSHDLQPLIDQGLNGLPENYRLPILLCVLEGKSIKEATLQLGWPQGTLAGRLARGRKLLAKRLTKRGVVVSAASLAAVVSQKVASAGVPTSLMISTVKIATLIAAGQATVAGVVPAKVAALMEGVLRTMLLSKLKTVSVTLFVVLGAVVFCGGLIENQKATGQQAQAKPAEKPENHKPDPPKDLSTENDQEQPKDKLNLPRGPFTPVQGLVKLSSDKKYISLQTLSFSYYEPVTTEVKGKKVTAYVVKDDVRTTNYKCDAIQVYVVGGQNLEKLEMTQLPKILKEETVALVSKGGVALVDPLHFRLLKEGTLLFVLPTLDSAVPPQPPADGGK
jgi:RNA polymerase sigma factor (sigma-70 family)